MLTNSTNRLSSIVSKLARLPKSIRNRLITFLFAHQVKFAGTAGIEFELLEQGRAVLVLKNRKKAQNHIGTLHAAAMALLAESATGAVLGMSLPDTRIPLLKSMQIDYRKRAQKDLRAEATLTEKERERIATQEKGEIAIAVKVTDQTGQEPISCQFIWAWVPKKK